MVVSINMIKMVDLDDRRDDILKKVPHHQTFDKIGNHDVKILGFQEKIDKTEEEINVEVGEYKSSSSGLSEQLRVLGSQPWSPRSRGEQGTGRVEPVPSR